MNSRNGCGHTSNVEDFQMKLSKVFRFFMVSVVLFLIIFFTNQKAFGENWIFLGYTENDVRQYYDKDSITILSPSVKKVWRKIVIPIEKKLYEKHKLGISTESYSSYSYDLDIFEVDCKDRILKMLYSSEYDKKGTIIDSKSLENPKTFFITPGSIGEGLYKAICP
jgi:hypothetical protein